jgi:hypothetical protein
MKGMYLHSKIAGLVLKAVLILTVLSLFSCVGTTEEQTRTGDFEATVAVEWMELLCQSVRTEGLVPPQAARIYAYAGIALYESVVQGMPDHLSLSGQLNDLPDMPEYENDEGYDWPSSANAALAKVAEGLFEQTSVQTTEAIRQLKDQHFRERISADVPENVVQYSSDYGESIGEIILDWADEDGYQSLRSLTYTPPSGTGIWEPTPPNFGQAMEPFWGQLRPFSLYTAGVCEPQSPVEYSEDPSSEFYNQAWLVYEAVNNLDSEQRTIALFWEDSPQETCTPPGHWLSIVNQLVIDKGMRLDEASEMYALVGISMGDTFISCWEAKYRWNLLRPVTYIQRNIDSEWQPYISTPPFPEYTSGHSVVSGAVSTILTHLLGEMAFTDRTHEDLGFSPRSYSSFDEAAQEAAISRLYGGIHYPMAIEEGLEQGWQVGQWVLDHVTTRKSNV